MTTRLRVLIVEDRASDVELMIHELRRASFEPAWQCVETEADYTELLSQDFDVVLADYNLPQFSALQALHLLQERGLEIPFIVVTGTLSDEAAVECMRKGADDYLLKDRLARLGQAVEGALQERQLRKERRALEEQLLQAQKMEAVGELAGGIAHDFNNLLTGIIGYSQLLLSGFGPDTEAGRDLAEIRKLADRAASLTRQLLAFSRPHNPEFGIVNLNEPIGNFTKMLGRIIGKHIDLEFLPTSDLDKVRADLGQIEQVVMNLAINARDAMPNGGKLTIQTANVRLDSRDGAGHAEVQPGSYVMLKVEDTGCGMDKVTLQRIFEPFFTTKGVGQGTGLGLSTVYGIVKQHGGHVWVDSEPGKGTVFKIYLPRVEEELRETAKEDEELLPRGSETILVAEDDEGIRLMIQRFLEGQGYHVLCAANSQEAEEIFVRHDGEIDLLLTDIIMPGGNGRELYERCRARQHSLKVLFMSACAEGTVIHDGVLASGRSFLQKPFPPATLAQKVRHVLEAKQLPKILVVDDEPAVVDALERFLKKNGYAVVTAFSGEEATAKFKQENPQVVLLDIHLPDKSGLDVLREFKQCREDVAVIMISGAEEEFGRAALKMGIFEYIPKPFNPEYLEKVLWWQLKLIS